MKLIDIIQRIQSLHEVPIGRHTVLRKRHIYNKLKTLRSLFLSQELKKKNKLSEDTHQTIYNMELVLDDKGCINKGCTLLRTKNKLPSAVVGLEGGNITKVTTLDDSTEINRTTKVLSTKLKGNRYTGKSIHYYFDNGFIYIVGTSKLGGINVRGVFDDPVEALKLSNTCGDDVLEGECLDILEMDFPIDNDKIELMVQHSVQEINAILSDPNTMQRQLQEQQKQQQQQRQ